MDAYDDNIDVGDNDDANATAVIGKDGDGNRKRQQKN